MERVKPWQRASSFGLVSLHKQGISSQYMIFQEWVLVMKQNEPPFSSPTSSGQPAPSEGTTSGLAIASLVLGILSVPLTCLTGFAGGILGIVALVKINRSGGQIKGTGIAVVGLTLSAIMSAVGSLALIVALVLPAVQAARDKARQQLEVRQKMETQQQILTQPSGPPESGGGPSSPDDTGSR